MAASDGQLWSCAQAVTGNTCDQRVLATAVRPAELPLTHLRMNASGVARVLEAVKPVLRALAKGLWIFVLAIPVKLLLRVLNIGPSDYITFVFVLYVVLLFSVLALVVLLQWLAGPRSARQRSARLQLPHAGSDADERLARMGAVLPAASSGEQLAAFTQQLTAERVGLRLRGTLSGGRYAVTGAPLVLERWEQRQLGVARYFVARPFAVVADGQPPVLVELSGCATLLADYHQLPRGTPAELAVDQDLTQFAGGRLGSPDAHVYQCVLRHGDAVELIATSVGPSMPAAQAPLELLRPQHDGGPYRGEQDRLIVAESHGHSSLVLRARPAS